ncbi:MAG: APC family permease, partial [Gammaproteobacteria bacterium]
LRVLRRRDTLALAFGAMIGWSWVLMTGEWLTRAGTAGAMMAFAAGGAVMVCIALAYAELASALPETGGEHVYSLRALGPGASFVCSWAIVLGYVSVAAFEAVALPYALTALIPGLDRGYLWTIRGFDVHASFVACGIAGAVFVTWVNVRGVGESARLQNVATTFIISVGLVFLFGAVRTGEPANLVPLFADGAAGIAAVLIMIPIMFVGFDVIPQAAAEIDVPHRALGQLIVLSVLCAMAWYCAMLAGVAYVLPPAERGLPGMTTAVASARAWGAAWGGQLLVAGGIAGILTTWNAFMVGASRLVYALAASGMLPAPLARLHPRHGTPHVALIAIGALTCCAPWFGRPVLIWLVNAGSLGVIVGYLLVTVSFLRLRTREPSLPRPYAVKRWRLVGGTAVVLSLALIALYLPGSAAALTASEWAICGAWTVLGILFFRRHRAVSADR